MSTSLNEFASLPTGRDFALLRKRKDKKLFRALSEEINELLNALIRDGEQIIGEGRLDVVEAGFGFLRLAEFDFHPTHFDIYVSKAQITKFDLHNGCLVQGLIRPPKNHEQGFALISITSINGEDPETFKEQGLKNDKLQAVYDLL